MTDVAKTEIMSCVIVRVYYKFFDDEYRYFVDVQSSSQHQNSWSRQIIHSRDAPDSEILSYCFFIHLKIIKHIQKVLKKKTTNLLKKIQYRKLYDAQEKRCYLCNSEMGIYDCSVDHVVPVSKGGSDKFTNKMLTHAICNTEKANRMPTDNELNYLREVHNKVRKINYYNIIT